MGGFGGPQSSEAVRSTAQDVDFSFRKGAKLERRKRRSPSARRGRLLPQGRNARKASGTFEGGRGAIACAGLPQGGHLAFQAIVARAEGLSPHPINGKRDSTSYLKDAIS
ncbi:hypothetical protein H8E77_40215 [bacterium]|nr:hypothetical protein [bacterium]